MTIGPDDRKGRIEQARALLRQGKAARAFPLLHALVHEDPDDPMARTMYINSQVGTRLSLSEAQERIRELIAIAPDAVEPKVPDAGDGPPVARSRRVAAAARRWPNPISGGRAIACHQTVEGP